MYGCRHAMNMSKTDTVHYCLSLGHRATTKFKEEILLYEFDINVVVYLLLVSNCSDCTFYSFLFAFVEIKNSSF